MNKEIIKKAIDETWTEKEFSGICFGDEENEIIEKCVTSFYNEYLINSGVSNNILIRCEQVERANVLGSFIASAVNNLKLDNRNVYVSSEEDFVLTKASEEERRSSAILITNFKAVSIEKFIKKLEEYFEYKKTSIIVCTTVGVSDHYIYPKHNIFYDFFLERVKLNPYTADNIYEMSIGYIEKRGFTVTEDFKAGIKIYIEQVYDSSRNKEWDFVYNLYSRVIQLYRTQESLDVITEACIPYRKKGIEESKTLENIEVPIVTEMKKETVEPEETEVKVTYNDSDVSIVDNKNEENVILLSMSLIHKTVLPNFYQFENDDVGYIGISQLEAGSKYFISKLAKDGKKIDRIVIMESDETRLERVIDNMDYCSLTKFTSVNFYKNRICSFMRGEKENDVVINKLTENVRKNIKNQREKKINPSWEKAMDTEFSIIRLNDKNNYYNNIDAENLFVDIPMGQVNIDGIDFDKGDTYFWDVVKAIKSDTKKVNLYIDMQGGDRNDVAMMNAVVGLLKDQNVEVTELVATKYQPYQNKHLMNEVSNQYKTYDLITAMQVFKRYGRGDELLSYFSTEELKGDFEKKLTHAIKKASDSIQYCDVDGFDAAIAEIAELKKKYETRANISQLELVYKDIIDDFAPMIDALNGVKDEKGYIKYRYVEQIRWCLKKHFIQQALTILESKMPTEYVTSGLCYFCSKKDNKESVLKRVYEIYCSKYKPTKKERYKMGDINHYFINGYEYDYPLKDYSEKRPVVTYFGVSEHKMVTDNIKEYKNIKRKRNEVAHASSSFPKNGWHDYIIKAEPKDNPYGFYKKEEDVAIDIQLTKYLDAFEALAKRVSQKTRDSVVNLA